MPWGDLPRSLSPVVAIPWDTGRQAPLASEPTSQGASPGQQLRKRSTRCVYRSYPPADTGSLECGTHRKERHPQALARQRESVWLASTSLCSWRVSQQAHKVWVLFKELLLCCALGWVIPVLRALLESFLNLLHPHGSHAHALCWFSKPGVWRDSSFRCRS